MTTLEQLTLILKTSFLLNLHPNRRSYWVQSKFERASKDIRLTFPRVRSLSLMYRMTGKPVM
jgi:hypothetical protein